MKSSSKLKEDILDYKWSPKPESNPQWMLSNKQLTNF